MLGVVGPRVLFRVALAGSSSSSVLGMLKSLGGRRLFEKPGHFFVCLLLPFYCHITRVIAEMCPFIYRTHTQATHKHNSATQPATTRRPRQQQAAAAAAAASYYHHPTTAQAAAAEQHAVAPAVTHRTHGMHRTARTARTHARTCIPTTPPHPPLPPAAAALRSYSRTAAACTTTRR